MWSQEQLNEYAETSFLYLPGLLTSEETSELNDVCWSINGRKRWGRSHHWGRQEHYADTVTTSYKQWCIDRETLMQKGKEDNIRQIIGVPSDVLFFDCNIIHGSDHNISPLSRKSFIISYNNIDNKPWPVDNPRPDWMVARQFVFRMKRLLKYFDWLILIYAV